MGACLKDDNKLSIFALLSGWEIEFARRKLYLQVFRLHSWVSLGRGGCDTTSCESNHLVLIEFLEY